MKEAKNHIAWLKEEELAEQDDSECVDKFDSLFWKKQCRASELFYIDRKNIPSDLMRNIWISSYFEVYEDGEAPSCDDWSNEMYWGFFALRKFVGLFLKLKETQLEFYKSSR